MRKNQMEIRIKDLDKYYGRKHALKHLTLTIPSGMFGLLGRNGAGKTTLMKVLATLLKKQSGEVTICGIPVEEAAKVRRITGYLPQDFSMYPNMGVYEAMDYLGALSGLSRQTRKERIPVLLKKVNLQDEYRTKVRALSGGMKQRLGIAQAMLNNPSILVLDEPTAGLDPKERVRFRNLISRLGRERIVLLSTHIVSDVEYIADTIFLMKDGKLLHQGSPEKILQVLEGKVWECLLSPAYAEKLCTEKSFPIVNIRQEQENVLLRLISSQKPSEEAMAVTATLEDLYLYY